MFYKREIDDPALIQFIILYTLDTVKQAIPYDILINLVLENCNITYTDFQIGLGHLLEMKYARTFDAEKPMYEIEPQGSEVSKLFIKDIPVYIREPIKNSIKPMLKNEIIKNRIKGDIFPLRENDYAADCGIYDDDGTPLLELKFYTGAREQASEIAQRFTKKHNQIYTQILKLLTED